LAENASFWCIYR